MKIPLVFAKCLLIAALWMPMLPAWADAVAVSTPQPAVPPNIVTNANRPMMMLVTSKDHTLFSPIYTDFEDIDGDGALDTTYLPSFKYYGYFDSTKCYAYSTGDARFNPSAAADTSYTYTNPATVTVQGYSCKSNTAGRWSGNFLNWATMSRLDVIRKLLYGGKRSTDTATATVLERAPLSMDSHGFVKYYKGLDIEHFTPFTTSDLTKTTGSNATTGGVGTYAGLSICNRSNSDSEGGTPLMLLAKGNYKLWATVEGQACQWGPGSAAGTATGGGQLGPKLARYYKDELYGKGGIAHEVNRPSTASDGALGNASELTVRVAVCVANLLDTKYCRSYASSSKPEGLLQEFGLPSATSTTARTEFGMISGSYDKNITAGALRRNIGDMRDEVNTTTGVFCHATSSGCTTLADTRTTGTGAIKAIDNIVLYGKTTSSYPGASTTLPSELTDGTFPAWGNPIGEMVVQALKYYAGATSTNPGSTTNDTAKGLPVATWRDPLSDTGSINAARKTLYGRNICRPLNVLALSSSALSFDQGADTQFADLPNRESQTLSNFTDTIGVMEGIKGTSRSVAATSGTLATADAVAAGCSAKTVDNLSSVFGICPEAPTTAGTYKVAGAAFYANTHRVRDTTSMTLPADLPSTALKVKTYAAALTGGAPVIKVPVPNSGTPPKYVYITPEALGATSDRLGVRMPMSVLTFDAIAASPTGVLPWATFLVTWNNRTFGGDYDMDIAGFLRYDVVVTTTGSPSGYDIKISTDIVNVGMGSMGAYGFSVIGTNNDGRLLTHRHMVTADYDNALLATGGNTRAAGYQCGEAAYLASNNNGAQGACKVASDSNTVYDANYLKTSTLQMLGATDITLQDPLWYAAKYGSFSSENYVYNSASTTPLTIASYDAVKTDGSAGQDDTPDGYFLARRPDLLEDQLRRALDSLTKQANAAPASSGPELDGGSFNYKVSFDSGKVTGNLEAYPFIDSDEGGNFATEPSLRAGQLLRTRTSGTDGSSGDKGNSRVIITNLGNRTTSATTPAIPFRWSATEPNILPAGYKTLLTTSSTNTLTEANAQRLVQYMRGDQSLENASTGLRVRGDNMLGPIVNSTPWMQNPPQANFLINQSPGYANFSSKRTTRPQLLWVAANDGMLHAFDPSTLAEKFAYVPGMVANRLAEIPMQRGGTGRTSVTIGTTTSNFTQDTSENKPDANGTVWPYVDGNPFTADVKLGITTGINTATENGTWATYLFSTLGRGGRGVFALDVSGSENSASWSSLNEGSANTLFKWQFSADDDIQTGETVSDLGYVVGDIGINGNSGQASPVVKLNNGKFALLLNNGVKSASGKAALYLLFVDGPDSSTGKWNRISSTSTTGQYVKIVAAEAPTDGTKNGLATPLWIDRDGNGTADVVYAGDLKGNMWKFDISSTNAVNWKVAYKTADGITNRPLFTAQYPGTGNSAATPLAITTAPEYVYPAFDGLIINFGTGNAFETGDFPIKGTVKQRFYGVWDNPSFANVTTGTGPMIPANATTLVQRTYARNATTGNVTVTADSTDASGTQTFTSIEWGNQDGWYFNLPDSLTTGEAVLTSPDLQAGFLVFTSVRSKIGSDNCNNDPDSTLFTIDPIAGRTTRSGLTVDGAAVAGISIPGQKFVILNNATSSLKYSTPCSPGTTGCVNGKKQSIGTNDQVCKAVITGSGKSADLCYNPLGRVQWREIPGLRTTQ